MKNNDDFTEMKHIYTFDSVVKFIINANQLLRLRICGKIGANWSR